MKRAATLPKMAGSLHLEFKQCGRSQCRCRRGLLHGPYLYRHWREGGRQRKAYVPIRRFTEVMLAVKEHRESAARPSQVAGFLKERRHG